MLRLIDDQNLLRRVADPGTWLHVHCAGGAGRTTTTLAMLALLAMRDEAPSECRHRATQRLHRIARVQYVLGGSWLLARPPSARLRAARDLQEVWAADSAQRKWSPAVARSALLRSVHRTDASGRLHPAPTRHESYAARDAFLHLFAQYVSSGESTIWSDWLRAHLRDD